MRANTYQWTPYIFLSPFFVLFAAFWAFPLFFSFYLSFQSWDPTQGLKNIKFVGLDNFRFLFSDPWYWTSIQNTAWLTIVAGTLQHLVAIPLAYFINKATQSWRNGILGFYFLPYITSAVAISLMSTTVFSTDFGLINMMISELSSLSLIGEFFPSEKIDWLNRAEYIKPVVSLVVFWRYVGFNTLLYMAALQTIPKDVYEAAEMDGANEWQKFRHITLPYLYPMIFFAITLSIIGGMQLFEEPFLLTGGRGGTDQAALTTALYMYRTAFEFNDFGTASATSWSLFIMIAVLMVAVRFIMSRNNKNILGEEYQ